MEVKQSVPRSIAEVYKQTGASKKYERVRSTKHTEVDVAELMIAIDESVLADGLLVFEEGMDKYSIYMAEDSGIWKKQLGMSELAVLVEGIRKRIEVKLLTPMTNFVMTLRSQVHAEAEDAPGPAKLKEAERELAHLAWLDTKLGTPSFVATVLRVVLQRKVVLTRQAGVKESEFDTKPYSLGFEDGVYDCRAKRLLTGEEAKSRLVSATTGYRYDEMREVSEDETEWHAFTRFFEQIHVDAEIRRYLLSTLHGAAHRVNNQLVLVHYNAVGSNGKSTWFDLVKAAFGDLYVSCKPELLVAPSFTTANAPNEELMSMRSKCVAVFSEPSVAHKLQASFIKGLTGGDMQSARGLHEKKQSFVLTVLPNILCNKIPNIDDMDGGIARRIKLVPYKARFVPAGDLAKHAGEQHVYALDATVSVHFDKWRMCLMRAILEQGMEPVDEPQDVRANTQRLLDREDSVGVMVRQMVVRTGTFEDVVKRTELQEAYEEFCAANDIQPKPKAVVHQDLARLLGEPIPKSGGVRNFWRGIKVVREEGQE